MTGAASCAGTFTNGVIAANTLPDAGIVLSTGDPTSLPNQNSDGQSKIHSTAGDADLSALVGGATTNDACVLEITFTPDPNTSAIGFTYVFGSDEYNEFSSSSFIDVFGLFLNGNNRSYS